MMPDSTDRWMNNYVSFERCIRLATESSALSRPRMTPVVADGDASFPSLVEFRADVELCGAHVLDRPEFLLFVAVLEGRIAVSALPESVGELITQKVGAELLRRGVADRRYFDEHSEVTRINTAERERRQRIAVAADRKMRRRQRDAERAEDDEIAA